jgi:hypothetical protein
MPKAYRCRLIAKHDEIVAALHFRFLLGAAAFDQQGRGADEEKIPADDATDNAAGQGQGNRLATPVGRRRVDGGKAIRLAKRKDTPFAETLYRSLQDAGVRVFRDRFEVLPGESLHDQVIEAIHQHDRLIVVLSDNGMASDWARQEIELAWYHKRDSLVPIRLCEIDRVQGWTEKYETLPDLAVLFPVLDFSAWREEGDYARTVSLLLRSLAGGLSSPHKDGICFETCSGQPCSVLRPRLPLPARSGLRRGTCWRTMRVSITLRDEAIAAAYASGATRLGT